jgi:hypothetical protein
MAIHVDEGESLEDALKRRQLPPGPYGSHTVHDPEAWLAKHASKMALMPRPCKTAEEWLSLYAPRELRASGPRSLRGALPSGC